MVLEETGLWTCAEAVELFGYLHPDFARFQASDVTVSEADVRACLEAMEASCDWVDRRDVCRRFFVTDRPAGALCANDSECSTGHACVWDSEVSGNEETWCEGRCEALRPAGAECRSDNVCASANCLYAAPGAQRRCSEVVPVALAAEIGAPCGEATRTATEIVWCGEGLRCVQPEDDVATCHRLRKLGQSCTAETDECLASRCGASGRCEAWFEITGKVGASCGQDELEGREVECDPTQGLVCVDHVCVSLGKKPGELGDRCAINGDQPLEFGRVRFCAPEFYCRYDASDREHYCTARRAHGERCDSERENECLVGLYCATALGADFQTCLTVDDYVEAQKRYDCAPGEEL